MFLISHPFCLNVDKGNVVNITIETLVTYHDKALDAACGVEQTASYVTGAMVNGFLHPGFVRNAVLITSSK